MPEATKVEAPKPVPVEKKNEKEEEKSELVNFCGVFYSHCDRCCYIPLNHTFVLKKYF